MIEKIKTEVERLIEDDSSLFLVDVILKGNQGNQKLIVLVDGDDGIQIDRCAKISRKLGNMIEEEDLISSKYTLEVSSPGLDMPLLLMRQYRKNIGRNLKIELEDGGKELGQLKEVKEEGIVIEDAKKKILEIEIKDISRTFVEVSFK